MIRTHTALGSRCISSPEMLRDLLNHGADPDWQCLQVDGGYTALHCAVSESVLYPSSESPVCKSQSTQSLSFGRDRPADQRV
jgi:hypothetical protein